MPKSRTIEVLDANGSRFSPQDKSAWIWLQKGPKIDGVAGAWQVHGEIRHRTGWVLEHLPILDIGPKNTAKRAAMELARELVNKGRVASSGVTDVRFEPAFYGYDAMGDITYNQFGYATNR